MQSLHGVVRFGQTFSTFPYTYAVLGPLMYVIIFVDKTIHTIHENLNPMKVLLVPILVIHIYGYNFIQVLIFMRFKFCELSQLDCHKI